MIRNVTHTKTPPDAVLLMELGALLVSGDLPSWSQNELGARWKCGRGVVRRIATLLANQYRTMTGPAANHYRTTLAECFSHLAGAGEPALNQHRTSTEPTRARSSSKSKKEMEKEKNNTPAKPAVDSVPYAELVVWLSAHMPGSARVTSKRRPKLKRIWKDYDRATLERLGAWLAAKQHPRARYLADKGHGIDTVIAKVDQYVELMEAPIQVSDSRGPSIDDLLNHHPERVVLDAPLMLGGPNGQS